MAQDPYGLISSGLPPELAAEMSGLSKREALAQALLQQSMKPLQAPEVKGRFQGRISPFQGLAQLAQAYVGGQGLQSAEEGRLKVADAYNKAQSGAMSQYEQTRAGLPERPAPQEMVDIAQGALQGGGDTTPVNPTLPAVPGDPRKAVSYALTQPYKPLRDVAQKDIERDFRSQEAITARADRAAQQESMARLVASLRNPSAPTVTTVIDPKDKTRLLSVDARVYKQGGSLGDPGVFGIAGKEPSVAKRETELSKGKSELAATVQEISSYYDRLEKLGAVVDPANSAVSNVINRLSATGTGQFIAGAVGTEAQTERDKIGSARAALMAGLKQATGMSAQALNSNAELAFYMQMATDPARGIGANRAALSHLNKRYNLGLKLPSDPQAEADLIKQAPGPLPGEDSSSTQAGGPTYVETRVTKDGRKLGKKADGTVEEIK